jgi:hypothetical protein
MSRLNLHIFKDGNQTRTRIGKPKGPETIVFHNDSGADLQIDFSPTDVIQNDVGTVISNLSVPAGGKKSISFVPSAQIGTSVKYTATISGASAEDPIIILD